MRSSLPSDSSSRESQLPARRTVVSAAAWTVPLLSLAVASPMASASETTAGFDLAIIGLQFGDSQTLFTPDYSQRYSAYVPLSNFGVANYGDVPSPPEGFWASYTVDNELSRVDRVGYRLPGETERTYVEDFETIVTGTRTEFRWLVPVSVAVNESTDLDFPTGAVVLVIEATPLLGYPNDAYDPQKLVGSRVSATSFATEANTANNLFQAAGGGVLSPASPYAAQTEAAFETAPLGIGPALTSRPTSVKITSIGPKPIPAAASALVRFDYRSTTTYSITNIRLNGEATLDYLQNVTAPEQSGWPILQELSGAFGAPLAAGDVLEFDVVYDEPYSASYNVESTAGQAGFIAAVNSDPDLRTTELTYVYGEVPA